MESATGSDKRTFPFFQIDNAVVTNFDLTPYEGWLYVVIVSHINRASGVAFPSLTTLAKETRMSRRKIIMCIQSLETKGLLSVTRIKKDGSKESEVNHYALVDTSPQIEGGSAQDAPQVVHDVHSNHKNTNQNTAVSKEQKQPMPPKPRKRNPYFDLVAWLAFQVPIGDPIGGRTGARVGTILAEMKESHGGTLPPLETIQAAYDDWCIEHEGLTPPADAAKFDKMVRDYEAKPAAVELTYLPQDELDSAREDMFGIEAMQRARADYDAKQRALGRVAS
jgi:biotin operon repressor